jgi:hypothetical protein
MSAPTFLGDRGRRSEIGAALSLGLESGLDLITPRNLPSLNFRQLARACVEGPRLSHHHHPAPVVAEFQSLTRCIFGAPSSENLWSSLLHNFYAAPAEFPSPPA